MRIHCFALISILLAAGCAPPPEAPEELGELSLYLFRNFDSEGGELAAGAANLARFLQEQDMAVDLNDRAVRLPILTVEDQGSVRGPEGVSPDDQVPLGVWASSEHDLDANLGLITEPNQVCIQSDGTRYYARTFDTDTACFLDGSCDLLRTHAELRFENFLASAWLDTFSDYRSVTLEDGRRMVLMRGWMEEVAVGDSGVNSWDQRFTLEALVPSLDDPSITLRLLGSFGSVTITGVTDQIYEGLLRSGIQETFDNGDDFAAGRECSLDRDRPYDRPQD